MISCRSRASEREKSLAQLARAGLTVLYEPYLNPCDSPANTGGAAGRVHFERSLTDFMQSDEVGMVLCEDDIDVMPAVAPALELAVMLDVMVDFCVWRPRHHPWDVREAIKNKAPLAPGVRALESSVSWFGTQFVYLPRWLVSKYLTIAQADWHGPFDTCLQRVIRREHLSVFGAYPNPVQHRNPHSVAALVRGNGSRGRNRVSDSFGLPLAKSWASLLRERGVNGG